MFPLMVLCHGYFWQSARAGRPPESGFSVASVSRCMVCVTQCVRDYWLVGI